MYFGKLKFRFEENAKFRVAGHSHVKNKQDRWASLKNSLWKAYNRIQNKLEARNERAPLGTTRCWRSTRKRWRHSRKAPWILCLKLQTVWFSQLILQNYHGILAFTFFIWCNKHFLTL